MKLTSSLRKIGGQLINPWVAATAMAGLLMAAPPTYAVAPPANTLIGNQASATYVDPNGQPQSSTSNLVQTTIQQVGSFNLDTKTSTTTDVVNTKTGAAGTTVYASHVLTNTGNGTDNFDILVNVPGPNPATNAGTFSRVAVFKDANFDGLPDNTTDLCSAPVTASPGTCTVSSQTVAGNGGQFGFIVAYTLPATATTPTTPFGSALITAKPVAASLTLYAAGNQTASDVDNINLTTAAAFNLNKTIAQPGAGITAPAGGLGAWPTATNSGPRSSADLCPTSWSALTTVPTGCQYTVYTLTYTNTGGAPGRFVLQDVIGASATAGMTYVTGSAVWSNKPGTALAETAGAAANTASGVDFAVTAGATGNVLTFVDNTLPVNVTRSISFVVLINNTAALGTSTTTNTATYNPTDATGATAGTPGTTGTSTNGSPYTTTGTYSLTLSSLAGDAVTGKDATPGTPNAGANDTTTVATSPIGGSVPFTVQVWNTGNAVDSVNIVATNPGTGGGTAFPAGTTFLYFKADGATPLADTNGDGIPDTGPVQPGTSTTIVVRAVLPTTAVAGTGPYTLTVTGTSIGNSAIIDATRDVLTSITGIPVDVTNTAAGTATGTDADLGPLPAGATPTTTNTVQAGGTTAFSLFIKNNDAVSNTYTLAASSSNSFPGNLPAGWTVKFVDGAVAAASCATAPAISTTASVATGAQIQVTACVTVPSSQTPITAQPVYFQVKSVAAASTGALAIDVKLDAVTVNVANILSATIGPITSIGQTTPGGSVVYPQTLTNTGNASCTGPYTVSATLPAADIAAGWQVAIYLDANSDGTLDAGDTLVTGPIAGPLLVGGSQKFLVKVFSAAGAAVGASDLATISVTFPAGSCGTPTSTATTTIVTGQIRVLKTQSINTTCTAATGTQTQANLTAKPGQCIVYVVKATNEGTAVVNNLTIRDAVPSYTTLTATQPTTKCTSSGVTPAVSDANYSAANNAVLCGSAATATPVANAVSPSGSVTLTFQVQINE